MVLAFASCDKQRRNAFTRAHKLSSPFDPNMKHHHAQILALAVLLGSTVVVAQDAAPTPASLEETRITMGKWIETQQLIGRERNDWSQGKEILKSRIELVSKEVSSLGASITESQASVATTNAKRDELIAENDALKATSAQLAATVTLMEAEVKKLLILVPDPVKLRLAPLFSRIPEDAATTKVSVAERFQNVLGILNELNKANSELTVNFEVRTLADGSLAEVQVIYIGLAQAFYVSPRGAAGIGRPTAEGWKWESSAAVATPVLAALEILQGKQSPAFVPLPVSIR